MNQSWKPVCALADLKQGLGVCALVNNQQVAIFTINKKVFAINNYDPFSQSNVISRGIIGDLKGRLVVASPIYKQHFDIETGICLEDESVSLDVYPVVLVEGQVLVSEYKHEIG